MFSYVCLLALPAVVLSQCTNCNYDILPAHRQRLFRRQISDEANELTLQQPDDVDENGDLSSLIIPSPQNGIPGYLPDYEGDRYTHPDRIEETQYLNRLFFEALRVLESRNLLPLPLLAVRDDSNSSLLFDDDSNVSNVNSTVETTTTVIPITVTIADETSNSTSIPQLDAPQNDQTTEIPPKTSSFNYLNVSPVDLVELQKNAQVTIVEIVPGENAKAYDENYLREASKALLDALNRSANHTISSDQIEISFEDEILSNHTIASL